MKKIILNFFLIVACVLLIGSTVQASTTGTVKWNTPADLTGTRYAGGDGNGGITEMGDAWDKITLSWNIEETVYSGTNYYKYTYSFSNLNGYDPSHFIAEVSGSFSLESIGDMTPHYGDVDENGDSVFKIDLWQSGQGNPDLPEDFYGLKFDYAVEADSATYSLYTNRAPVWGVFYLKDGLNDPTLQAWSNALNISGYPDSTYDYNVMDMVARPDTVVPIPTTLLLLGSGLIGLIGIRRKFMK